MKWPWLKFEIFSICQTLGWNFCIFPLLLMLNSAYFTNKWWKGSTKFCKTKAKNSKYFVYKYQRNYSGRLLLFLILELKISRMSPRNINSAEKSVCAIYEECFEKFGDEKCIGEVNNDGKIDCLTFGEVKVRIETILEHLTSECRLENSQDTKIGFYTTNNLHARLFYTSLFTSRIVSVPVYPALGLKNILVVFSKSNSKL